MATFSQVFPTLPLERLQSAALATDAAQIEAIIRRGRALSLDDFAALLSPAAEARLETLAQQSRALTLSHFGKTIRMFAPLYVSNECINGCKYCGFSRHNAIPRRTIPVEQAEREGRLLAGQGFRSLLLVAGEHPKAVSSGYMTDCIRSLLPHFPSISLEIGPLETADYVPMAAAGCEGLVVYQETYHKPTYVEMHPVGPKKNYEWRMDTVERGYAAGFRRLGISPLYGLHDWRYEALATAAHALHLRKHCWKAYVTISFPRLRPAAGGFQPRSTVTDRQLAQLICAYRLLLPQVGLVLSTRESPRLRDGLMQIGITTMSAGSSTEPGGYSSFDENWTPGEQQGEQFHIADDRPPEVIADIIRSRGYEPVWKDFDRSLVVAN